MTVLVPMTTAQERRTDIGAARHKPPPTAASIARRRFLVGAAKSVLPLVALVLLASVALWPEYSRWATEARLRAARLGLELRTGQLTDPIYHGVDERGRPYTITATAARQVSPERVDVRDPKGDITMEGGRWLMARSLKGTYLQHLGSLDLSGDVQLYRDDGTVMQTDTATLDLKYGAVSSADRVHAEGPFGTLDAQGFAVLDRGAVVQFTGPGRLVLNGKQ